MVLHAKDDLAAEDCSGTVALRQKHFSRRFLSEISPTQNNRLLESTAGTNWHSGCSFHSPSINQSQNPPGGGRPMFEPACDFVESYNQELESRVVEHLSEWHAAALPRLQVTADRGRVTLRGCIDALSTKRAILAIVRRIPGVRQVIDDIELPAESNGDAWQTARYQFSPRWPAISRNAGSDSSPIRPSPGMHETLLASPLLSVYIDRVVRFRSRSYCPKRCRSCLPELGRSLTMTRIFTLTESP